jgi:iron complex outermembrane receptor protein
MHGGKLNEDISYRAYVKGKIQDDYDASGENNTTAHDNWENVQTGFRVDSNEDWLLEGSYMRGSAKATARDFDLSIPAFLVTEVNQVYQTGHILLRTQHQLDNKSKLQFQAYYDYYVRSQLQTDNSSHTFDLDAQYQFQWGDSHAIIWGLGYRGVDGRIGSDSISTYSPERKFSHVFSGFIQDEIQLNSNVRVTIGSKFSHNDYSGFEYQPSARLLWEVTPQHSVWSSVGYAVRTPTRSQQDIKLNVGLAGPFIVSMNGNPDQKSEGLTSVELGYRGAWSKTLSFDLSFFYNHYDNISSLSLQNPIPPSFTFGNDIEVDSIGVELFSKWKLTDYWQLMASYSYLQLDARLKSADSDLFSVIDIYENSDPKHQASLQSTWQLPSNIEFNTSVYYTDRVKLHNVDSFTRLDLRLAWKPSEHFELSIVGQNLLDPQHKEYSSNIGGILNTEVPRSIYAKIVTRF